MQTKTVISTLKQFRDKSKGRAAKNGGFTGQKGVFDKAISALAPYAHLSVVEALAALDTLDQSKARKASSQARRPRKSTPLDQACVNQYAQQLTVAANSGDFGKTRPVLDQLANDKSVKVAEMKAICEAFVGARAASRKDALARIEQSIRSGILKR